MALIRSDNPILPVRRGPEPEEETGFETIEEQPEHERTYSLAAVERPQWIPTVIPEKPAWVQITETDGNFVLLHDGKLYAATPVDSADVVHRAFNRA